MIATKKINWGIIGLGNIANAFAKDLSLVPNATLRAVASRTKKKAKEFAKNHGAEKAYGSYEKLFKDDAIDIIYIATPHNSHANLSIAAMKAGKAVLCEKPLAVNKKQVKKMIKTAKKQKVFMMEAFWSKFNPSVKQSIDLAKNGRIGDVNYVNVDFSFYKEAPVESRMFNLELAGGALLDVGVYPVFLAYSIFGKPNKILATARFHETGADIQTAAILKYKKGIANVFCGFASESDTVAKIYGTRGRIFIDSRWHETQSYRIVDGSGSNQKQEIKVNPTRGKGFTYEIEECMKCLSENKLESDHWSHKNSLELITIVDEIRKQCGLKYPFEK